MDYCLCMRIRSKQQAKAGSQIKLAPSIDDLVAVFQGWRADADTRRAKSGTADPALPRVPYEVQQVASFDEQVIAHFHRHYKVPNEVIGKLTLRRPDLAGRKGKRK